MKVARRGMARLREEDRQFGTIPNGEIQNGPRKQRQGRKEGMRDKSLATIEMESCYLRGEGEFAELKRSPATDRLSGWSGSRR